MIVWIIDNSLPLLLLAGTCFSFYWLYRKRESLQLPLWSTLILAVAHTIVGLCCVKLFAAFESMSMSGLDKMSLFGAIFFLPPIYWMGAKLTKRDIATVFDVFTPCVVFTLLCARINCIFSGCCLGQYIGYAGWRYPTRELEIVFYILLLLWIFKQENKTKIPGLNFPVYMTAYGAFRFIVEGFRTSDSPMVIHISHIWAVICFCLGLSIYYELKRMKNKKEERKSC